MARCRCADCADADVSTYARSRVVVYSLHRVCSPVRCSRWSCFTTGDSTLQISPEFQEAGVFIPRLNTSTLSNCPALLLDFTFPVRLDICIYKYTRFPVRRRIIIRAQMYLAIVRHSATDREPIAATSTTRLRCIRVCDSIVLARKSPFLAGGPSYNPTAAVDFSNGRLHRPI